LPVLSLVLAACAGGSDLGAPAGIPAETSPSPTSPSVEEGGESATGAGAAPPNGGNEAASEAEGPDLSREPAPEIAGRTLQGQEIALSDLIGTPVFVNVWASW
jgi:hypothetical protein